MKIAICGLLTSENLGELFIADSLKNIVKKELLKHSVDEESIDFVYTDILANNENIIPYSGSLDRRIKNAYDYRMLGLPAEVVDALLKHIAKKNVRNTNSIYKLRHYIWQHSHNFGGRNRKYFEKKFKNVDVIIIDGAGLLEYSANEYQEPLLLISQYGEENNIPVIYNAIGRSGEFDPKDYRCQVLMKALRSNAVKYVSARDSLESVQACVGSLHEVKLMADAAFQCAEAYRVYQEKDAKKIGIGLIRGDSLQRYGIDFSEEDWVKLFVDVGKELKRRGYTFFYFTNGMPADYEVGKKVLKEAQLDSSYLEDRPTNAKDLMQTLAQCQGIITCRMHSSIATFSMKIPSVVFSWNKKVDRYMDILGFPDRAISVENFNANFAVDCLENAIKQGISASNQQRMALLAQSSAKAYVNMIVNS